jgi:hypothetical protein
MDAVKPAPPPWPKACRCGEVWSRSEWPELPPVGRYLAGADGWIELRTCVCGATLVVAASELESSAEHDARFVGVERHTS